jgi:DNA-binding transcriptional MerR regulator
MNDDAPTTPRLFTSGELARFSGNKLPRIEFWTRLGILVPEHAATRGGTRLYSLYSVLEAGRIGLFADRGLSSAQLQQLAEVVRTKVRDTVRPEPDFDLHARAAYGFFIQSVNGMRAMFPVLADDPVIKRFLRRAEARYQDKQFWRLDNLHPGNVESLMLPRAG